MTTPCACSNFETLKSLGASPASKFIFPMEFTQMLGSLAGRRNVDD